MCQVKLLQAKFSHSAMILRFIQIFSLSPITLLVIFICAGSKQINAQAQSIKSQQPTARKCGGSAGEEHEPSDEARKLVNEAVFVMDSSRNYHNAMKFALTGTVSEYDRRQKMSRDVGTFTAKEDHTVANGDFTRKYVVNGLSNSMSRTEGQVSRASQVDGETDLSVLAFIPRSYLFPLAVLQDDLSSSKVAMYMISNHKTISLSENGTDSLIHLHISDLTNEHTTQYDVEDWYFDPTTHVPVMVGHQLPIKGSATNCAVVYTTYEDYQLVSGSLIPTSITDQRGGPTLKTMHIKTVSY